MTRNLHDPEGTFEEEQIARPLGRAERLLSAAIAVQKYLESPKAICCAKFDIPDDVYVPFCEAIDAAVSIDGRKGH